MKRAAQAVGPDLPSAPSVRRQRSVAVGACLTEVVAPHVRKQGLMLAQLLPFWPQICPLLAAYAVPEAVQGNTLVLAAATSSAQRELQFLAPSILEGANRVLGYEALKQVKAVVRSTPQAKATKLAQPLQGNSKTADKAAQICKSVPHDELREALQSFGTVALVKE